MAQQYSLKWNNHQPNFISMFAMLRNTQALVDVTLAAEGRHLHAHKMVLSACSPYFHSLFVENPSQHPIVILKDVAFSDLRTIVDFMYYGEVNITQEELPQMLHSAKSLKVKGLTETESTSVMRSHSSDFPFETSGEASGEPSGEHTGETLNELSNDPSNEPAGGDSQRKITASPCNSPSAKRRRRRRSSTASTSLNIVCDENRADNQMEIVRDGITLSSVPRTQQSVCPPPLTSRNEIISGRVRNDVTAIHRDLSRWFGLAPSSSRAPAPTVSDVEDKNAEPQNISIDDLSVDHNPAGMPQGGQWSMMEHSYPRYTNSCFGGGGGLHGEAGGGGASAGAGGMYMGGGMMHMEGELAYAPPPGPNCVPPPVQLPEQPVPTPLKRRRTHNPQSEENFQRALEAVRIGGIGFCKAARMFGVNNRTLWLEYKKKGYPNNRPSIKSRIKREHATPPPHHKEEQPAAEHHMALLCHPSHPHSAQQVSVGFVDSRPLDLPLQTMNILGGLNFNSMQ